MIQPNSALDELLNIPFPFACHPDMAELEHVITTWMSQFGLIDDPADRLLHQRTLPGRLTAYIYPDMNSEIFEIAGYQLGYQFAFDEYAEAMSEAGPASLLPVVLEQVEVTRGYHPENSSIWGRPLADLRERVLKHATPAQSARWAENYCGYLHGLLQEAVQRATGQPPELDTCIRIHSLTNAVRPLYPLCEMAQRQEMQPAEIYDKRLQRLALLSGNIAGWINDVYSVIKEVDAGITINLVLAYQSSRDMSLGEAVRASVRQVNSAILEYLSLSAELRPFMSAAGIGYLEGMTGWIRGAYYYCRSAERYTGSDALAALLAEAS
jgi:hypothetical protein